MRGGFVHNQVLVGRLDAALRAAGARTSLEHPTGPSAPRGFVDILATRGRLRVVCEAELRASRVALAIAKAEALHADYLLLVAPDPSTARAVRAALPRVNPGPSLKPAQVFVLPLGQALHWVSSCFPFLTTRNGPCPEEKQNPKSER